MSFPSGPVTFKRFFVRGAAPKRVSEKMLDSLGRHAVGRGSSASNEGVAAGWITGDHILDTDFNFAKNAVGECVYAAMRLDTNKPPADLLRSYQRMHEQALLEKSGREFLTKAERREARDAARDQAEREARDGRFLRMRAYAALWDLERSEVLLGATAPAVVERFGTLFRETFGHGLVPASSGELASRFAAEANLTGAYEDLRPSQFVRPPEGFESSSDGKTPGDEARCRDYLGTEWLLWLWYTARREEIEAAPAGGDDAVVRFEKMLQLDCAFHATGTVSIRSDDPSHTPEAAAALAVGKTPIRAGLQIAHGGEAFACAVRADVMHFSGVVLPPPPPEMKNRRAIFEERIGHLRSFNDAVEASFREFLRLRLSSRWPKTLAAIRAWILSSRSAGTEPLPLAPHDATGAA